MAGFAISAVVAVVSTLMVVTRRIAVHALLYLVVSFLAMASIFWQLGAPFAAALELIVYAGAIVVLFVFVVMMLDVTATEQERNLTAPRTWIGPSVLVAALLVVLAWQLVAADVPDAAVEVISAKQVGIALYGPYMVGSELASLLLLAGLVGAFHLGRVRRRNEPR